MKKIREEKVPSIQVADEEVLKVLADYRRTYLICDPKYKHECIE